MLNSVEAVIEALGGTSSTATLAGVGLSTVSNWKAREGIPAEMYLLFDGVLSAVGKKADPALFGFKAVAEARV